MDIQVIGPISFGLSLLKFLAAFGAVHLLVGFGCWLYEGTRENFRLTVLFGFLNLIILFSPVPTEPEE